MSLKWEHEHLWGGKIFAVDKLVRAEINKLIVRPQSGEHEPGGDENVQVVERAIDAIRGVRVVVRRINRVADANAEHARGARAHTESALEWNVRLVDPGVAVDVYAQVGQADGEEVLVLDEERVGEAQIEADYVVVLVAQIGEVVRMEAILADAHVDGARSQHEREQSAYEKAHQHGQQDQMPPITAKQTQNTHHIDIKWHE